MTHFLLQDAATERLKCNIDPFIPDRINLEQKRISHQATGHEGTVSGVAVSHKNLEAYTVSSDKTLRIWK